MTGKHASVVTRVSSAGIYPSIHSTAAEPAILERNAIAKGHVAVVFRDRHVADFTTLSPNELTDSSQDIQADRARLPPLARAWIDYIVDTKMPWGTRWLLGGGNRKHALTEMREAAQMESDFFSHSEAEFALWNMEVRERDMAHATAVARRLSRDFPDNRELAAFLDARVMSSGR